NGVAGGPKVEPPGGEVRRFGNKSVGIGGSGRPRFGAVVTGIERADSFGSGEASGFRTVGGGGGAGDGRDGPSSPSGGTTPFGSKSNDFSRSASPTSRRTFGPAPTTSSAGPSSASLLAGMYKRRDDPSALPGTVATKLDPQSREGLILKIREYLVENGGKARSEDILGKFSVGLKSEDVNVFRMMLKGIADFRKRDGVGVWKLKEEFM
ncbi:hypothetical protein HK097_002475, partial [Rhizophlyctis rosea]